MRRIRIIFEYLLAFVIVSTLLIAIAGVIIVRFYGDEVRSIVVREINAKTDAKIDIGAVNISAFKKFPSTSIVLEDLTIWSSHNFKREEFIDYSPDTLLHAETLYLRFNLFDLLRKKYSIKQLDAQNGTIRILTDSRGEENYRMLKETKEDDPEGSIFVLNELNINNFTCLVNNLSKDILILGNVDALKLNGNFFKKEFHLKTQSSIHLDMLLNKGVVYAKDQNLSTRINLDVSDSIYRIAEGYIQSEKIVAESSGSFIVHKKGGITLGIKAHTRDFDIRNMTDMFPASLNNRLKGLNGQGKIDLSASVDGLLTSTHTPLIIADFTSHDVTLKTGQLPFDIRHLNVSGIYTNGSGQNPITSTIRINTFSAEIDGEALEGSYFLQNFYSPAFNFTLKGKINSGSWIGWYDQPVFETAEGPVVADLSVSGTAARQKNSDKKTLSFNLNGSLELDKVSLKLKHNGIPFRDLTGNIRIQNDKWEHTLSGYYGNSDFQIAGTGLNLLSYLIQQKGPLIISSDFYADEIDLHQILQNLEHKSGGDDTGVDFPDNLNIKVNYNISSLKKDRFSATRVRGSFIYDSPLFIIDSLQMKTMEGSLSGYIAMTQDIKGNIYTSVTSRLSDINIQQLFYSFNNFGQQQITNENIRGSVSGTSDFSAEFNDKFSIKRESIVNKNDIVIRKGELKDFEPILALSKFIDVKELQDIHFATLQNTVLIRDSRVIIPQMDIKSNALDLSASGIHNLDGKYEYRIRLLLSELLYQKARKNQDPEYIGATDDSDTRTLFLKIQNEGREVTVEYDREKAAEKIREDLKQERNELKQLFNEELGLYRKESDHPEQKEIKSPEQPMFRFEFDDGPDNTDTIRAGDENGKRLNLKRNRK